MGRSHRLLIEDKYVMQLPYLDCGLYSHPATVQGSKIGM